MKKPKNKRHKKRRNNNNSNQHQQNLQQPQQQQSDNPKTVHTFSVYITTWNVSSRYPESVTVHQLLGLGSTPDPNEQLPDFYVIGLQEVNAQVQNVVINLFKEDPWTTKFKDILKLRDFVVLKTEQMQGLLLIVFVRRKHLLHVRGVEAEYTRTGLGGIWGNKGAVSIRMNMYGTSVVFVNAHLAAHDHMLEERVDDYNDIIEHHKFHVKPTQSIMQHDYVFWFGDLNFRLTGETSTTPEQIRDMVKEDKLGTLIERDQLKLVMNEKRAFHDMVERPPAFPPTFKFEPGTNDYDMKRRPAWCDRILYRVGEKVYRNVKLQLEQSSYKSHPNYLISDHKPVTSEFVIRINKLTTFTRSQIDSIDAQVFSDPTQKMVKFDPIENWVIGDDNSIRYMMPFELEDAGNDWIGVFKSSFNSLEEWLGYEYTAKSKAVSISTGQGKTGKVYQLTMPEALELPNTADEYVLMYFQSTGSKGVSSMVGLSAPFRAERRAPSSSSSEVDKMD